MSFFDDLLEKNKSPKIATKETYQNSLTSPYSSGGGNYIPSAAIGEVEPVGNISPIPPIPKVQNKSLIPKVDTKPLVPKAYNNSFNKPIDGSMPALNSENSNKQGFFNKLWNDAKEKTDATYVPIAERNARNNQKVQDETQAFINEYGLPPSGVFDEEAYDYYKKAFPNDSKIDFYLNSLNRVPVLNKVMNSASNSIAPGHMNKMNVNSLYDTKSNGVVLDTVGNIAGSTIGLGMQPGGGMAQGTNLLNITDDLAANIGTKVTTKVGPGAGGNIAGQLARGITDGAIGGVLDTMREGNGIEALPENILTGAIGGGALMGGSKALGEAYKGINTNLTNKVNNLFDDVREPVKATETSNITPNVINPKALDLKNSNGNKFYKNIPEQRDIKIEKIPKVTIKKEKIDIPNDTSSLKIDNRNDTYTTKKGKTREMVSKPSTRPIVEDYPELAPYIKKAAATSQGDLYNSIPGSRYHSEDAYNGSKNQGGTQKDVEPVIQFIQDRLAGPNGKFKNGKDRPFKTASYEDIRKALIDIEKGNGNYAIAKKIETILIEQLENGSVLKDGTQIPPNKDFADLIGEARKIDAGMTVRLNDTVFKGEVEKVHGNIIPGSRERILKEQPKPIVRKKNTMTSEEFDYKNSNALEMDETDFIEPKKSEDISIGETKTSTSQVDLVGESDVSDSIEFKPSRFQDITAKNSENVNKETKDLMKDYSVFYETKPDADIVKYVDEIIAKNDYEALSKFMNNKVSSAENTTLGIKLLHHFQKKKDFEQVTQIIDKLSSNGTKDGQAIQKLSLLNKLTPEGMVYQAKKEVKSALEKLQEKNPKLFEKLEKQGKLPELTDKDIEFIDNAMNKMLTFQEGSQEAKNEMGKILKLVGDKIPPTLMDKVDSYRYLNMLFNPKTLIKNAAGNMVNHSMGGLRDLIATPIDKLVAKKTGVRTQGVKSLDTYVKGFKKGGKQVINDHKLGIDTTPGGLKEGVKSGALRDIPGFGTMEKWLSTGLKMGDVPFYQATYDSYLEAVMKANKVTEPTKKMLEDATQQALESTFQQKTSLGDAISNLKNNKSKVISTATKTILPFSQTPSAILDTSLNYTPLGIAKGLNNLRGSNLKRGTQLKGVNQLSSGILGTGLMAGGIGLANKGLLEGSFDSDYETAQLKKQAGIQENSLKFGDKYISLDWMQPAASPFITGADISKNGVIKGSAKSTINSLMKNSYLSGAKNVMSKAANEQYGDIPEELLKGFASQMLPLNSLANATNKTLDNTTKDTTGKNGVDKFVKQAMAKYPGLNQMLPQGVDTVGEGKVTNEGDNLLVRAANNFLTPWNSTDFNPSKAEKTALDLYNKTGDTIQMPRYAPKKIEYSTSDGKKSYTLTQEEYLNFQKYIGEQTERRLPGLSSVSEQDRAAKMQQLLTEIMKEGKERALKEAGITTYKKPKSKKSKY